MEKFQNYIKQWTHWYLKQQPSFLKVFTWIDIIAVRFQFHKGPTDNMLVAWYQTGNESHPELIVIQFTDACKHYTSWGTNVFTDVPI